MAKLEIESRHSDYGEDAGGYALLRFDGAAVGRCDRAVAERLIDYVRSLEQALEGVAAAIQPLALGVIKRYPSGLDERKD